MRLSAAQVGLLAAVAVGDVLKVHRTLDGSKQYRLHPLDESPSLDCVASDVEALLRHGLIESNMKFPAATFLLTPQGAQVVRKPLANNSHIFHNN